MVAEGEDAAAIASKQARGRRWRKVRRTSGDVGSMVRTTVDGRLACWFVANGSRGEDGIRDGEGDDDSGIMPL